MHELEILLLILHLLHMVQFCVLYLLKLILVCFSVGVFILNGIAVSVATMVMQSQRQLWINTEVMELVCKIL